MGGTFQTPKLIAPSPFDEGPPQKFPAPKFEKPAVQEPESDQLSNEDLAALTEAYRHLAEAKDPRAEAVRGFIGSQTDSILHPKDPRGTLHKAWDWLNNGLISKDTFVGAMTGMTPEQLNKALEQYEGETPGHAAAREFTRGTLQDIGMLGSTFTSPVAIGTMGAGAAVSKLPGAAGALAASASPVLRAAAPVLRAAAPVAKAITGAAALGFGAQGVKQAVEKPEPGTDLPTALQQELLGLGTAAYGAAGVAESRIPQTTIRGAKAGAELVKTGTKGAIEAVGAQIAPTPREALTTALTRGQLRTTKGVDIGPHIDLAMPDLKAAEVATGKPVSTVEDLIANVNAAKKAVWNEYSQKLSAAQAVDAGPLQTRDPATGRLGPVTREPTINGNEVADAMEKAITKRMEQKNPKLATRIREEAAGYRRPMPLGETEDFLQEGNNDLHTYYAKNKVGRRVALGDPDMAATVAEVEQLRDSLYSKLDELTGPGAADIKKRYGALATVEESALRAKATQDRQSPMSLSEMLSTARGAGKIALGGATAIGGLAMGEPHTAMVGAGVAGGGLMEAGVSRWLKARQTTDALIERAFREYGQPESTARRLLRGERGEAGAPGTVEEPVERPQASFPQEQLNAIREGGAETRRSSDQFIQDVVRRQGLPTDPSMAEAEAAQRGRAKEMEQKYPVPQFERLKSPLAPPAEQPNVEPFYSKAEKAAKMLPGSATGQQMLATLKNQGVKPGELEQLGIEDYLKSKQKFSAQEVREFIAKNKLQVGEKDLQPAGAIDPKTNDYAIGDDASKIAKYEQYTLPGEKRNYTERLFTLPSNKMAFEYFYKNYKEKLGRVPEPGELEVALKEHQRTTSSNANFQSSHWDEPNVLAHARFDERSAADGKKVLFLEEAQSDWHQKGKKEGYQTKGPSTDDIELAVSKMKDPETGRAFTVADSRQIAYDVTRSMEAGKTLEEGLHEVGLPDGHIDIISGWANKYAQKGVPDAPFKTDWHELVVKRMLREAAERGADRLAWTTGDQQAERYDLSKQVGKVQYNPETQNLLAYDPSGRRVSFQKSDVKPEDLPNIIGKDAAQKLLATEVGKDEFIAKRDAKGDWRITMNGKYGGTINGDMTLDEAKRFARANYSLGNSGWQELSGLDLKTGGEWAKALYDRAIPNFLNKYVKKWGGKVSETQLGGHTPKLAVEEGPEEFHIVDANQRDHFLHREDRRWTKIDDDDFDPLSFRTSQAARAFIHRNQHLQMDEPGQKVHSIEITPALKKAVLKEGQPIASAATFGEERAG